MQGAIQLIQGESSRVAELDAARSRALLGAVASGERPESLWIWRPEHALAFSGSDRTRPGFARARVAGVRRGFAPFLRLSGGHAAVYTRATLAFAWAIPAEEARAGIRERFERTAALVAAALRRLGVDARVGAVAGEYCPGDHSVNARGRTKLMGVGQRVVRGAAHVGGIVVVGQSAHARAALEPVYTELALPLDPATVGSVEDEVPGIGFEDVREALVAELGKRHRLETASLGAELLTRAERLRVHHRIDAPATARASGPKLAVDTGGPRPDLVGR